MAPADAADDVAAAESTATTGFQAHYSFLPGLAKPIVTA